MTTKEDIVKDWLPRYTGVPLSGFGKYILLTNFGNYCDMFAERFKVEVQGRDKPMQVATYENLSIVNFGMGAAMAATVMDLLSAVEPEDGGGEFLAEPLRHQNDPHVAGKAVFIRGRPAEEPEHPVLRLCRRLAHTI